MAYTPIASQNDRGVQEAVTCAHLPAVNDYRFLHGNRPGGQGRDGVTR